MLVISLVSVIESGAPRDYLTAHQISNLTGLHAAVSFRIHSSECGLVKTVCPSRNGPNVRPELGMKIKDRQALIELVRKSVHRAMASESPFHLSGRAVERRGDGAPERTNERATKRPSDRENEPGLEQPSHPTHPH